MRFRATVELGGKTATGIEVPEDVVAALGSGNRPPVTVAGDQVDVDIEPDTGPREVAVPDDLAAALARDETARANFDGLSYTHRKEWVRWIEEAKKAETRATRLAKTVESLHAGQRAR
jgi:uncharacterized protein YdeI (YjbR/CyaY-like superfamily)